MCLAVPAKVVKKLDADQAEVELEGLSLCVNTALVEPVAPGDYVIVHVGYALEKLDPEEARASLDLFREGES